MKFLGLLLTVVFAQSHVFAATSVIESIDYAPNHVFAINGFDSNDNVELVLSGAYPNTCYKVGEASVKVDATAKRIDVTDKAFHYTGAMCLMMFVNYTKPVNLGVLAAGKYDIYVHDRIRPVTKAGSLNVTQSLGPAPDDFLYAPIDEVSVEGNAVIQPSVTLKGTFLKSCLRLKEVRVDVQTDVIVVQPIAEEDGSVCTNAEKKFTHTLTVPGAPKGQVLLHVRSLNGQSINRVLNL